MLTSKLEGSPTPGDRGSQLRVPLQFREFFLPPLGPLPHPSLILGVSDPVSLLPQSLSLPAFLLHP